METEKKKPRARRKKSDTLNPAASLLAALKFVAVAQKKAGTVQQQFGVISGNWAAASNGVLTVATKVEEDLSACPHTYQLIDALSKVGEELSITQLSPNVTRTIKRSLIAKASILGPCPMNFTRRFGQSKALAETESFSLKMASCLPMNAKPKLRLTKSKVCPKAWALTQSFFLPSNMDSRTFISTQKRTKLISSAKTCAA